MESAAVRDASLLHAKVDAFTSRSHTASFILERVLRFAQARTSVWARFAGPLHQVQNVESL